jgi:hypothetical protein
LLDDIRLLPLFLQSTASKEDELMGEWRIPSKSRQVDYYEAETNPPGDNKGSRG